MSTWWTAFGEWSYGRQRLGQALAMPGASSPTPLRAKALYDEGLLAFRLGDAAASRSANEQSLAIAHQLNDKGATATALVGLSRVALRNHDYATVRRDSEEAMQIRQALPTFQAK